MSKEHLNVKEAATYLNVSKSKLDKLRMKPGGPKYCKPAGRIIYRKCDLDEWMEQSVRVSTSHAT